MVSLFVFGINAAAAEYTAVLFSVHPNGDVYPLDTLTPNLWVKGNVYRYEGSYQEHPIIIISNKDIDKAWYLDVEFKTYLEVTRSEGGVPDPIQMWNAYFASIKKESLGEEKIKGYTCQKYKYVADNGVWAVQWITDSLGLYLKQITHYSETTWTSVELVNIKYEPIDGSLFELPEEYVDIKSIPPDERPQRDIKIPKKK
jgi:hypothetical protein